MRLLLLVLTAPLTASLVGCSDYKLNSGGEIDGGGEPDIQVEPASISLLSCASADRTVSVSNVGDAALQVSGVALEAAGWSIVGGDTASFSLSPGEAKIFTLRGTEGSGSLRFESDDPDEPLVRVPLEAVLDGPPTVQITAPAEDAVLDVGGSVTLSGQVSDDVDAASDLAITWSSDIDGVLSTDPADADGLTQASWASADRSPGDQRLQLTAVDSCGNSASDTLPLCQQAGYTSDELDISAWHFEGVAWWDSANDWLELTAPDLDVVGTAFATDTEVSGASVQIRFNFYIGGGTGADGISLTALDAERMTTFLGGSGCGIGYGDDPSCTAGPALPGWSIEVDTYFNEGQDPTSEDHIAFTFDGDVANPAVWAVLPEMEDTGWHAMEVRVEAPHLTASIDGVDYIDQDISGDFEFPALVGFTAGTGGLTNYHLIESLEVTDYACE